MQRNAGHAVPPTAGSAWTESAPKPENPWIVVPPLNNAQMSAAGIFAIGVLSDAITTTFNRAQFTNT
jgi:TolB-like protein